jgi:tape measure domain-containing protein
MSLVVQTVSDSSAARRDLEQLNASVNKITTSVEGVTSKFKTMASAVGATLTAAFSATAYVEFADKMTILENRIKSVTDSQKQFNVAFRDTKAIAVKTGQSVDAIATLYQRISISGKDIGLNMRDTRKVIDSFASSLKVAGVTGAEAAASITQFAQGLGSGKLAGDELKSLTENNAIATQVLTKYFKTTVGGLRQMGEDGKLASRDVAKAFIEANEEMSKRADAMGSTYSNAFRAIKENSGLLLNEVFKKVFQTPQKGGLANWLADIGKNIGKVAVDFDYYFAMMKIKAIFFVTDLVNMFKNLWDFVAPGDVFENVFGAGAIQRVKDFGKLVKDALDIGPLLDKVKRTAAEFWKVLAKPSGVSNWSAGLGEVFGGGAIGIGKFTIDTERLGGLISAVGIAVTALRGNVAALNKGFLGAMNTGARYGAIFSGVMLALVPGVGLVSRFGEALQSLRDSGTFAEKPLESIRVLLGKINGGATGLTNVFSTFSVIIAGFSKKWGLLLAAITAGLALFGKIPSAMSSAVSSEVFDSSGVQEAKKAFDWEAIKKQTNDASKAATSYVKNIIDAGGTFGSKLNKVFTDLRVSAGNVLANLFEDSQIKRATGFASKMFPAYTSVFDKIGKAWQKLVEKLEGTRFMVNLRQVLGLQAKKSIRDFSELGDKARRARDWRMTDVFGPETGAQVGRGPQRNSQDRAFGHDVLNALPAEWQVPIGLAIAGGMGWAAKKIGGDGMFGDALQWIVTSAAGVGLIAALGKTKFSNGLTEIVFNSFSLAFDGLKALMSKTIFQDPFGFLSLVAKLLLVFSAGRAFLGKMSANVLTASTTLGNLTGNLVTNARDIREAALATRQLGVAERKAAAQKLTPTYTPEFQRAITALAQATPAKQNQTATQRADAARSQLLSDKFTTTGLPAGVASQAIAGINSQKALFAQQAAALKTAQDIATSANKRVEDAQSKQREAVRTGIASTANFAGSTAGMIGAAGGAQLGFAIAENIANASPMQKVGIVIATAMTTQLLASSLVSGLTTAIGWALTSGGVAIATAITGAFALGPIAIASVIAGAFVAAYLIWQNLPENWKDAFTAFANQIKSAILTKFQNSTGVTGSEFLKGTLLGEKTDTRTSSELRAAIKEQEKIDDGFMGLESMRLNHLKEQLMITLRIEKEQRKIAVQGQLDERTRQFANKRFGLNAPRPEVPTGPAVYEAANKYAVNPTLAKSFDTEASPSTRMALVAKNGAGEAQGLIKDMLDKLGPSVPEAVRKAFSSMFSKGGDKKSDGKSGGPATQSQLDAIAKFNAMPLAEALNHTTAELTKANVTGLDKTALSNLDATQKSQYLELTAKLSEARERLSKEKPGSVNASNLQSGINTLQEALRGLVNSDAISGKLPDGVKIDNEDAKKKKKVDPLTIEDQIKSINAAFPEVNATVEKFSDRMRESLYDLSEPITNLADKIKDTQIGLPGKTAAVSVDKDLAKLAELRAKNLDKVLKLLPDSFETFKMRMGEVGKAGPLALKEEDYKALPNSTREDLLSLKTPYATALKKRDSADEEERQAGLRELEDISDKVEAMIRDGKRQMILAQGSLKFKDLQSDLQELGLDLSKQLYSRLSAVEKESLSKAIVDLQTKKDAVTLAPDAQKETANLIYEQTLNGLREALLNRARAGKADEAGASFAASIASDFNRGLQDVFAGKQGSLTSFIRERLTNFTSGVLNAFTSGLTEGLLGSNSDLGKELKSIGKDLFGLGNEVGGGPEAFTFENGALKTFVVNQGGSTQSQFGSLANKATGGTLSSFGQYLGIGRKSELAGPPEAGQEGVSKASTLWEDLKSGWDKIDFKGMFSKFTSAFEGIDFGGMFESLTSAFSSIDFSGLMEGITGMLGGGGASGSFGAIASLFLADGGRVRGPGTGTSDSIPAMLSNGEFVVNAAATRQFGPMLQAINNGRLPKFATGGYVGSAVPVPVGTGGGNTVVNLRITGDISRQTKKEIYGMLPEIAAGVNRANYERGR